MKPKTKLHHQVIDLLDYKSLLSKTKINWAKRTLFSRYFFETKHNLTCMECGHRWNKTSKTSSKRIRCPKCNIVLYKWKYNQRKNKADEMFMVLEAIKGFQVARYFMITKKIKVLYPASYEINEVANQWLNSKGQMTSLAHLTNYTWSSYGWSLGSPFEIREADRYYFQCHIYPKKYIHPHVYRNGYYGKNHDYHPMYLSRILLAYPMAETLLKMDKIDLFKIFYRYEKEFKKYWPSMIIAWRHGYDFESDLRGWFDHLDLLSYFKMDLRSPRYICSSNMDKEHIVLSRRRNKILKAQSEERKRLKEEEEIRRQKEIHDNFIKSFGKYFDLEFKLDRHTKIVVLKDQDDFIEEGSALHHCIAGYYGRGNSLIFSTRHKDKRIETTEFDLIKMEVTQSRGACNENSHYHEKIINTINSNSNLITSL